MIIYGYDFEVFSKINWWCVTLINYDDRNDVTTIINDRNGLKSFYDNHKKDIFVGYNSRQYDQFLFKGIIGGMNAGEINDRLIKGERGYQIINKYNNIHFNNYDVIIKDCSLKQLEGFMGDMIKETDISFDIDRPLSSEEVKQVISYNIHDVQETLRILDYTKGDFDAALDMIEMFNLEPEMFNKTKAQLSAHILGAVKNHTLDDEFEITVPNKLRMPQKYQYIVDWFNNPINKSYKLPLKDDANNGNRKLNTLVGGIPHIVGYGGVHGSQDNKIFEGIIVTADVASLYPSIMINEGYLSRKLKNPNKFKEIRDRRLELKKVKDKRQQPLKIIINSTYGILKDINSDCYDPLMSSNVCIAGQLYLIELTARLAEYCEILQTNTDGIYVRVKDMATVDKIKAIASEWENRTGLDLEWDVYKHGKLVQKDVNNYLLIDLDDKHYKAKGAYVKKLSPIDNDLPIINKALVEYFVNDIPVEVTINNCNELIQFQKIIKLSSLYKEVLYGNSEKIKVNGKDKIVVKNGKPLKEKVHRVFASNREEDKGIYKVKIEKGQKVYEKIANTPDRCFIDNDDIHNKPIPKYLNRQYYIDLANERLKQFLTSESEKIDETPNILYNCMKNSTTFYEFLEAVTTTKITTKVLKSYVTADCCNIYGKTKRLLDFIDYFNVLYKKDKFTSKNIEKKISDEMVLEKVKTFAVLSKTGKSYTDFNYEYALKWIFDYLPNIDIEIYDILKAQIDKFDQPRYVNSDLSENLFFVLNARNVIAPNLIIYNIHNGEVQYRKVDKDVFNILPLQDGDIFMLKGSQIRNGLKIIGKDERGINLYQEDKDKKYDVITKYEVVYRNYKN